MVLAVWACAFACGIAVAILGQAQVVAGFALAALGLAAWSLRRRAWVSAVAAATLAAGVGLGIRAIGECQAPPAVPEDTLVRVLGQVVTGPEAGAGRATARRCASCWRFIRSRHLCWKPEPS